MAPWYLDRTMAHKIDDLFKDLGGDQKRGVQHFCDVLPWADTIFYVSLQRLINWENRSNFESRRTLENRILTPTRISVLVWMWKFFTRIIMTKIIPQIILAPKPPLDPTATSIITDKMADVLSQKYNSTDWVVFVRRHFILFTKFYLVFILSPNKTQISTPYESMRQNPSAKFSFFVQFPPVSHRWSFHSHIARTLGDDCCVNVVLGVIWPLDWLDTVLEK